MSVNDFNRGTESQSRAHYAFMRKQGEATAEVGKRIVKKINHLGNIVDVLVDKLTLQEMDRVFGICSSLDIGVLDSSDQIKLLSYLKAMTTRRGQTTQQQLDYFFAVKRYLNIGNVADTIDFNAISELDLSRSELKAFFECICEFLFLKTGTKVFLNIFKEELDCFGFNDNIVDEIVSTIEKTYHFFGVQGIIEHYSLEPIKREEAEEEKLRIPFFEKPFAIIYNGKEKHHGEYAEMLKASIEERLDAIGVDKPQIRIEDENKPEASIRTLEETRHLVFIGEPKSAKDLLSIVKRKWAFNRFGMKFGTSGEKSIIVVEELKKKDRKAFAEYVKQNTSRWESGASKTVRLLEKSFFDDIFENPDEVGKGEAFFVNTLATAIGWPLLLAGGVLDIFSNAELKDELLKFQYYVAIDSFISSKIAPYSTDRK